MLGACGAVGRGLGTRTIVAFLRTLLAVPAVTKVQADPHPHNARAIRCYEKAGFTAAGEVVTPDGPALLRAITRAAATTRANPRAD